MTRDTLIRTAVTQAGSLVLTKHSDEGIVEKEGRGNMVTAADYISESTMIDLIQAHFPGDRILSEEKEGKWDDVLTWDRVWVMDPLDGTNNFRYERNYSAVSLGYIEKGHIKLGAAYDPFRGELFYAELGNGSFVGDKRLQVTGESDLAKAVVATDNSYDPVGTRRNLELVLKLKSTPWTMLKGSAVLQIAEVAAGRMDLYFQTCLKPWDNAAALLFVSEAGGIVRGLSGEEIPFTSPEIVVGNSALVNEFIQQISHK